MYLIYLNEPLVIILELGYSRKNPHPPDGWHDFLTPPSTRISGSTRPPLPPGFPSPKTPPPARISINFFRGLNFNRKSIEKTQNYIRKIFLLFLKTLVNIFAKLISIINKFERVTFERALACSSLNATCLFSTQSTPH